MSPTPSTVMPPKPNLPLRFCLSGGLATAAHYLAMLQLIRLACPSTVATSIGALVGALVNYGLQKHFTFASRIKHCAAFSRYSAATALGWGLNLLFFTCLHVGLRFSIPVSQVLSTLLLTLCNYWVFKRYVFL